MDSQDDSFVTTVMPAVDVVHNLARGLVRRAADAEDLVQDTLVRAWEAWTRGVRPDSLGAWLSTICLNLARDRARRAMRSREAAWIDDLDLPSSVDVEDEALRRVQRERITRALWELPEPQRVAIVLMDVCGLTAAETATVTRSPRGTVLARVHRGRKALAVLVRAESAPQGRRTDQTQEGGSG